MRRLTAIFCLVLTAGSVSAQGVLYDCDIAQNSKKPGWIPARISVVIRDTGEVYVMDPIILALNNRPMIARVERNDAVKLNIRWTIKNVVNGANQKTPFFDYTAQINKKNRKIAVYANPENYPNRFSGKGKCTERTE